MIFSGHTSEHYAAFAASQESLDEIREFVQTALLATDLGKKSIAGLLLAIEEVVSNIVRHGYLYGPGRLRLRIRATGRVVTITIHDNGRPFEVDWQERPDTQQLAETGRRGGLGLLLIRKVTDAVSYKRVGDENILTLTKHIGPTAAHRGHRAFSARVAAIGMASLIFVTLLGATLLYMRNRGEIRDALLVRWQEFARAAAASATQHLLNERSDAEFDQLVVGLKQAQPDVRYLVILDAAGHIRAHSENPERVHSAYMPPAGGPGAAGHWMVDDASGAWFHFSEAMTIDRRTVGSIALGVNQSALGAQLTSEIWRLGWGAAGVIAIGGILVGLVSFFMGRPLRRLGEMLHAAKSQGAVANITPGSAPDEIAEVVTAINEVTEAVARTERQIARRDLARREMEQAEQLQRALLPLRLPEIPGYETQAAYRMAQHVGGDYYDIIPIDGDEGLWALLVADVAGKGFPAALVMTAIRTAMRILAPSRRSPVEILQALDEYLERHHAGGPFVTIACGVLDTKANALTVASAGHTPVLHHLAGSGIVLRVNPRGRPVGVRTKGGETHNHLSSQTIPLDEGDAIILYTDGLTEARDRSGEPFGTERIEETLRANSSNAGVMMAAVLSRLNEFADGGVAEDDVTVLILRRRSHADEISAPASDSTSIFKQNIAAAF